MLIHSDHQMLGASGNEAAVLHIQLIRLIDPMLGIPNPGLKDRAEGFGIRMSGEGERDIERVSVPALYP